MTFVSGGGGKGSIEVLSRWEERSRMIQIALPALFSIPFDPFFLLSFGLCCRVARIVVALGLDGLVRDSAKQ